ncbi:MAG: NUDIX domain-containing protein [Promethearchaeota archaeon]
MQGENTRRTETGINSPVLAVDAVIRLKEGGVLFIRRRNHPFKDWWALPGGLVQIGETVEAAVIREVKEETGLCVESMQLIGVFSNPNRDPRGHTVSVAYLVSSVSGTLKAGSDAAEVQVFNELPKELAFDHRHIIDVAGVF